MSTTVERRPGTATTTIASRLADRARSKPKVVALRHKDFGIWQEVTWAQYWDRVQCVGHALLALGVQPGDRVAIHSENRPEWAYVDVASVAIRAVTMGLYPTNPPEEVRYLLANSASKVLIAEDQEQVDKALEVIDKLPGLERIVYLEPRGLSGYQHKALMSWEEFCALGRAHQREHPGALDSTMAEAESNDLMTLIYTSGTTGPPKGAMLTVANIEFAIAVLVDGGGFCSPPPGPRDELLSYLPLCHVAERIFTMWFNLAGGCVVNFAESIETVAQNLREVQPSIFLGVPRIWEKLFSGVEIRAASASRLKRLNYRYWTKVARRLGETLARNDGNHTMATRLRYRLGWLFLYRTLKERLGLSKCRFAATGAAPIAPEIIRSFMGIGIPLYEVYGMTENAAVATSNRPGRVKVGTVGEPHPGTELRVDESTGEVLTRHPGVFAGYWRNEEATAEAIGPDGWLHTGDVGEWVEGTHLRIIGRIKDIIITSGGKNISPGEIENALKASPFVKEAVVIGDRRPYLTALVGIELDAVGDWAQRRGLPYTTYRDLSEKAEVIDLIQGVIEATNQRFASVEQVKRFKLLGKELDHEDGELTATQKVKRAALVERFADLVESMYRAGGHG